MTDLETSSVSERIIVCLRVRVSGGRSREDPARLDRARFFIKRAEAFGATVCCWTPQMLSFAFPAEDLEEAIEFVVGGEARPHSLAYSIGMSQGEIVPVLAHRGVIDLGWGTPVTRAQVLARAAHVGEVLVDAELDGLHQDALLTAGSRLTTAQGVRLRGLVLDTVQPWRLAAESAVEKLSSPRLIGRDDALAVLQSAPGTLSIVRADPGMGGTRLLQACAEAAHATRVLAVAPAGHSGEPLGALRMALARSAAIGGVPELPANEKKALEGILSGVGTDIATAAYLIEEWMASSPNGEPGLVVMDDASDVDGSTLDALASAVLGAARPFGTVVRLDAVVPLPVQLVPLPSGSEVRLQKLDEGDAVELALAWVKGEASEELARSWARRAAGVPLAIREIIAEGLSSGDLAWTSEGVHRRVGSTARVRDLSSQEWISRRLRFVNAEARELLVAVAVLGGDATRDMVEGLLRAAADAPVLIDRQIELLTRRGWLLSPQPDWIALPTRTHGEVVLDSIPDARRMSWHRAASLAIESHGGQLALAEAARHASFANDRARAARLAVEASKAAALALLQTAAQDLLALARTDDQESGQEGERGWLGSGFLQPATSVHGPASSLGVRLAARPARKHGRPSYPPVEVPGAGRPTPSPASASGVPRRASRRPKSAKKLAREQAPRIPGPPALPFGVKDDRQDAVAIPSPAAPEPTVQAQLEEHEREAARVVEPAVRDSDADSRVQAVDELAASAPLLAREALAASDVSVLERWVEREPMTLERERLLTRVRAMVALDKGEKSQKGEALRALRESARHAQKFGPLEQSRGHLAYAIGLAQAGRALEALVEGLEALARAREGADSKAERACASVLHKIYVGAGHEDSVAVWAEILRQGAS